MEWLIWGLVFIVLWIVVSVIALALVAATSLWREQCTCLSDYDDDNDRTCARCHE